MTIVNVIWGSTGLAMGIIHALSLWRATRLVPKAAATIVRFASIAALFVSAALVGRILAMASGWGCAFPITVAAIYFRKPTS